VWPDDEGRRTRISCGRGVDGCVWVAFAGRWRCNFMVRCEVVVGWMGVHVAGPARFFGCVGGQNGFLVFLDFYM